MTECKVIKNGGKLDMPPPKLLGMHLPEAEPYLFAEERRLFYAALPSATGSKSTPANMAAKTKDRTVFCTARSFPCCTVPVQRWCLAPTAHKRSSSAEMA